MFNPNKKAEEIFSSEKGKNIYERIFSTVIKHGMQYSVNEGALVGFSGGADSVLLLLFLLEYQRRSSQDFKILCVHVNHNIRGEEAMRDEIFSQEFVKDSTAEFERISIDVPSIAENERLGLEEAARNARYSAFRNLKQSRNDIHCIAVAHNATDNMETVIFNMLRGSGLAGICGIKPVRDDIVRPLIGISKAEIVDLLDSFDVPYVTDSTNLSSEYSRNYIRNEILPLFKRISKNPEAAISRMTENLLADLAYADATAHELIDLYSLNGYITTDSLKQLSPTAFARTISLLSYSESGAYPEEAHINSIADLLNKQTFTVSLPGSSNFVCERGKCRYVQKKEENTAKSFIFRLNFGENKIDGTNLTVYIGEIDETLINVYNFSIKTRISSAIIDNGIFLRTKNDGDAYKYSGITHKLKKVYNDRKIPPSEREYIPILSDNDGIIWVPGLSVRDGAAENTAENNVTVTFCYEKPSKEKITMYTALNRV